MTDNLPTPPASSAAPSQHASPLPQARRRPLNPGGPKESELITYLDHSIAQVQKRIADRHRKRGTAAGGAAGYRAFWEAAKDLDSLVDVVWVSGSPNLQVPYLLHLAILVAEFLPLFDATARSIHAAFRLLIKLDYAFASLLTGHDIATSELLSGFENGRTVSTTDKVRLKGIVERTRLTVVRVTSGDILADEDDDTNDTSEPMQTDTDEDTSAASGHEATIVFEGFQNNDDDEDDDEEEWERKNVGSVYDKTIDELGDMLGGSPIGIITEDWGVNGTEQERGGRDLLESAGDTSA